MSSNVGLSTPRGSGTSGYVQRNLSHLKPRDSGYGSTPSYGPPGLDDGKDTFKQRKPDQKILEHDRRREIEVKVLEERDRLEEENERIDEEKKKKGKGGDGDKEDKTKRVKLSEEEIEERLDALRARLTKELEDELAGGPAVPTGPKRDGYGKRRQDYGDRDLGPKGRKQFKPYQVHELAEAKIQESERLRRALGIREEGEEDFSRDDRRRYDRGGERHRDRDRDDRYDDRDGRYRDRGDDYDERVRRYRDRDDDLDDRDRRYRDRDDPGDRDGLEEYRRRF